MCVLIFQFFHFLQNRKLLTPRHSRPNRAQPPNHPTQHSTRPNTQHSDTRHPPEGRPLEGRGSELPPKVEGGVNSRPGREEVANSPAEGEEGANAQPEGVECEQPPKGSEGKPPLKGEGGGKPPLKEAEVEKGNHPREKEGGGGANHRYTGRWTNFILMSFGFILKRGTAAPAKEGRGRKHRPNEAEGGSTTKRGRRSQRGRHTAQKGGGEREVHLSLLVVLPSFSSLVWGGFFPVSLGVALILLLFPVGWCRSPLFFSKKKKH